MLARGGRLLTVVTVACAAVAVAVPGSAGAQRPPSFVHVMTDDQTIDSMRHMPLVDRVLRRRGTKFTNYHATGPICCPSRASFLTGQYPHNHGVLSNMPPYGYGALDFSRTLYTALHGAGYRTAWIGKVLNSVGDEGLAPEPGFDEWLVPLRGSQHDMFDYAVSDNGTERRIEGVYQNRLYRQRAMRFIEESGRRPLMLTLSTFSPHWTICPGTGREMCPPVPDPVDRGSFRGERFDFGPSFRGGRERRARTNRWWRRELESLQSVDRLVRSLVAALRRSDRLDDTYLIFHSDNGLLHGQHGFFFEKHLPWDRSVRVPLLIRGPGFRAGARRADLTANVDLPATILDAAAVEPPLPADGHSLLGEHRRRFLLLERLISRPRSQRLGWWQIKDRRGWTYWEEDGGERHLYKLGRDPEQLDNRVEEKRRLVRRMRGRLARHRDCANPCP
jgi:N-acetylglucosamine-6-sulfatase